MAKRYGRLPTEILGLTIEEFSLNSIIFTIGMRYEASCRKGRPMILSSGEDGASLPEKLDSIFSRVGGRKRKPSKGK